MLYSTIFVCFVINLCFIECEGNKEMVVIQNKNFTLCTVEPHLKYEVGDNVTINIINNMGLIFYNGSLTTNGKMNQISSLTVNRVSDNMITVTKDYTGQWKFYFTYLCGAQSLENQRYWRQNCMYSECSTNVTIVDPPPPTPGFEKPPLWILVTIPVAIIAVIIMIAQTICILHFKSKAQALAPHKHLTKVKLESNDNDGDRYCSSPRHKLKKVDPPCEMNRASEIYEEPNINLVLTSTPPVPSTPRPIDRGASTMRLLPPPSATSTLLSNVSANSTFPRPTLVDQDTLTKMAMARRAPQPLPQEEFYSETTEEEVYEQPPTPEPPSPVKPMIAPPPMKKPITPGTKPFAGKQLPEFPMGGLKPWNGQPILNKPTKPPISQSKPLPPRNNVMQVPILQIPGPSSLRKTPAIASKPIMKKPDPKPPLPPPNPKPAPFVNNYPQHTDSSDEEWTYEELPKYNIYST